MLTSRSPILFGALLLFVSCASTSAERAQMEVDQQIGHGEFTGAVRTAAEYQDENPDDEFAHDLLVKATTALHLAEGRRLTFSDRDDEALAIFREVLERSPNSPQAKQWVEKTENKLGTHWNNIGLELHAADDLPGAIAAYNTALTYLPENESSTAGLATARFLSEYRQGVGSGYYTAGIRALSEYYLQQANNNLEKALKYKEEDQLSTQRREQVQVLLSDQRAHLAKELEDEGLFGAARHEYKMALDLNPENREATEGMERAGREAKAKVLLTNAEMQVLRGNFDEARKMLAEGKALTNVQADLFEGASNGIEDAVHERMYLAALDHYRDGDYKGAVAKFDELLKVTEYYKDTRTRRDNLQADIVAARTRYKAAQKADTDEERLRLLREIEVFWTNYRDIQQQIHRLEGRD